ncbi:MAG: hypothetical protein ABI383_16355 [Acidobacteriaceae bacterium]
MKAVVFSVIALLSIAWAEAQIPTDHSPDIERVQQELNDTRSQLALAMRQVQELKREVEELNAIVRPAATASATAPFAPVAPAGAAAAAVTQTAADEDPAFLAAKVDDLHQSKVESESKRPVTVNGLILFNAYGGNRAVDVADRPNLVLPSSNYRSNGSIGATLRQTILGIDATGPRIFGAETSADASIDFSGGSPTTSYGVAAGLLRLRTANVHLDWGTTRLHIGQDTPFISPLSPTSYATVAEPALSWSGNLWVWTPQVMVERQVGSAEGNSLLIQGGLMDPLTEERPPFQGRQPTAGEQSRMPAFAGRIAWDRSHAQRFPLVMGLGGYRARQQYESFPSIASWTINSDLLLPLSRFFQVSGEWYTGQAAGGLGGGIATSVIFPESTEPHTAIHALRSTGGWGQLKFTPNLRFEVNGVVGQDENFGQSLRFFSNPSAYYGGALKKNRTAFGNVIYKPNSFLLFALEYRRLMTEPALGSSRSAGWVNIAAGVRF